MSKKNYRILSEADWSEVKEALNSLGQYELLKFLSKGYKQKVDENGNSFYEYDDSWIKGKDEREKLSFGLVFPKIR